MSRRHAATRGIAGLSSGVLVVGAGASLGILAAQMHEQWTAEATLEAAAQLAAEPQEPPAAELPFPRPVVVTVVKEKHVTPEPVIVHRKVYVTRTVPGGGGQASQLGQGAARVRSGGSGQGARPVARPAAKPAARPARARVAPAPAAPRPAAKAAPSAPKSTTS